MDDDGDLLTGFLQLVGGSVRWLFFLGKKKFNSLMEDREILNGIIGLIVCGTLIWLFFRQVLIFIRHLL